LSIVRCRILEVLILDPGIGIVDVAVEQVLAVVAIGFQIGFLDLVADEFGIAGRELGLDEFEIAFSTSLGNCSRGSPARAIYIRCTGSAPPPTCRVEGLRQNLEGEARAEAVHAFIDTGGVLVFLHGFGPSDRCPSGFRRHRPASW
jgi:hypothetical protein